MLTPTDMSGVCANATKVLYLTSNALFHLKPKVSPFELLVKWNISEYVSW